ncbi:ABC transporter ATP-binding protein [Phytohalomonas tamaricis]|uniref:ABC transporter ATP-binding protein n=1 Tax=Phytohalomonas tamaricis TaxID=2081032 RepID=UPI000D0ADAD7|nr:ABC transporter ATP-binding protein [Phytohalomonas tamaricis]
MAIVELKNVVKNYGGHKGSKDSANAVENFNLLTEDGEFVVLVGPSGCGKSTTMRMIAGLENNTGGEIRISGRDVSAVPPKDRDIAMVFQSYALYPHMSVFENMAFSLRLKKTPNDEVKRRVNEAASILNIEHLLERKPRALSGGQRQRVALGRAIVRQPQVFLMDEPLSNLDAKLRVDMRAEIVKLHRKLGVTTFYVTHDQVEAMTMGQRIVVMLDGKIQQVDTPQNLYERPNNMFVAGFIGTPSMNFLRAKIASDRRALEGESFRFKAEGARGTALDTHTANEVWVGVRPEHLRYVEDSGHGAGLENMMRGTIEVVEPLGAVTMVQVQIDDARVTAQLDSHVQVTLGETITLACAGEKLHLFDADSEQALGLEQPVSEPLSAAV